MRRKPQATARPETIDDYLAPLSHEQRTALERLRAAIRAAAPAAEECISYGIPTFRLDGKMLVSFGAAASHCAFYPGAVVGEFEHELGEYRTSKGTICFQPEHPLPATLVRKIVKAQVARKVGDRTKDPR